LKRDLAYLMRLWKDIETKMKSGKGPAELNVESDLITRTLRDVVTPDVKTIIVDDREVALRAKQFIRLATPRSTTCVLHYQKPVPLFDAFDIERQIQSIHDRVMTLESGVSLVFDTAEAIVAVDVNSGKFRDHKDAETTAFKTNMEAVDEIARQLRLRDLGGIIVLDLIDMYQAKHRREVEKRFKDNLKKDKAKTRDLRISELGLLELTRQRMRPSLHKSAFRECPTCKGSGRLMSLESIVLDVMRRLGVAIHADKVARVELVATSEIINALLNRRREAISALEGSSGKKITFKVDETAQTGTVTLTAFNQNDNPVEPAKPAKGGQPRLGKEDEITLEDVREFENQIGASPTIEHPFEDESTSVAAETEPPPVTKKRRRRRRRGGAKKSTEPSTETAAPSGGGYETAPEVDGFAVDSLVETGPMEPVPVLGAMADAPGPGDEKTSSAQEGSGRKKRRRRRGGRRHRGRRSSESGPVEQKAAGPETST
jgi:ribonuclease E